MKLRNPYLHLNILDGSSLILGCKIATIVGASLAIFYQDFVIIANDALQTESMSYMLAIPFIFAYLIYRKRKMLRATISIANQGQQERTRYLSRYLLPTVEILLVVTAMVLYWYGSYTFQPLEYHMFAFPIFVAGLLLILFNPQTLRQLAFSIAFLIFLVPPPAEILYGIGASLSVVSSQASNAIVSALRTPSYITTEYGNNPTIIITRPDGTTLPFAVDIACSGIYSLIGLLVFIAVAVYIIRDKPWKKLTLALLGIPLIYVLNIVRITIILLIGYNYGEEMALRIFHLLGGWVFTFLGTLLLLLISKKIFKTQLFANSAEKCSQCDLRPQSTQSLCFSCSRILKPAVIAFQKRDIMKLVAISLAVTLLTSIQVPVFALTEGSPLVTVNTPSGEQVSTDFLPQIPGYNLSFVYSDTAFQRMARQDLSLIYQYSPITQTHDLIWVTIEMASTRTPLHRWEVCFITWPTLIGGQPQVTQIDLKDVQLLENPPITGRYFVFQYNSTKKTQAVLYWYESATFRVNSTSQQKQVKISVIVYPESLEDLPRIENQMMVFGTEIANYWEPIKTWSQIALLLSKSSISLLVVISALLVAITVLYALETKRLRKAKANLYKKLSESDRKIIESVRETERQAMPTLENIAATYQKTTAQSIDINQLLQRLLKLEKIGITKSSVISKQDEPTQTWKA